MPHPRARLRRRSNAGRRGRARACLPPWQTPHYGPLHARQGRHHPATGENFAPGDTGGVGLLVHRLAAFPGAYATVVVGAPQAAPFADVAFQPAPPAWLPVTYARRYAAGVARALRDIVPVLIEVHNRPDMALFLAARFPDTPVMLFLHNDPHGMRRADTAAQRSELLAKIAKIVTVSAFLRGRLLNNVPNPARIPGIFSNCIDLSEIPAAPAERDPVVLFAGRVVADKGADILLVPAVAPCRSCRAGARG